MQLQENKLKHTLHEVQTCMFGSLLHSKSCLVRQHSVMCKKLDWKGKVCFVTFCMDDKLEQWHWRIIVTQFDTMTKDMFEMTLFILSLYFRAIQ